MRTLLASCKRSWNSEVLRFVRSSSCRDSIKDDYSSFILILCFTEYNINIKYNRSTMKEEGILSKELYNQMLQLQHQDMPSVIATLEKLLQKNQYNHKFYHRVWKALFFALWNYDKMMNQHLFSQEISHLVHKLAPQKVELFLEQGLDLLDKYWNRIDHHRINKFMKLVRYLLKECHIYWRKNKRPIANLQNIIKNKVFYELQENNGLRFHVLDIYTEILEQAGIDIKKQMLYLDFVRQLLFQSQDKVLREYVVQKIYEKIKGLLQMQQILKLAEQIHEKANEVEDESLRRSLYGLIGFLKSEYGLFISYKQRKKENIQKQQLKQKKKKISKGRKEQIVKQKAKRKIAGKQKKKADIISKRKIQMPL